MLTVGLLWEMACGCQLTLVELSIEPVFVGVMCLQKYLVAKCEVRNKRACEEVAGVYYEKLHHRLLIYFFLILSASSFSTSIQASHCLSTGVRGTFFEECSYDVVSGLVYLAEALLLYVGAVLIAKGTHMCPVLNPVDFTISVGSQLMVFPQTIVKSVQATPDLN
ncbi:hypothetical protein AZE42_09865 [Rhizopogon vesiculosus]|uniref:Uncharacterized protein n=1 Tax=Rhizopogon vesiculosus TaxID=180088 RepID=A0A1J8PUY3_9AGAM|nr:hypothetical protein AZE42_09865 [Rhizopogon vesiculosus]